MKQSKSATSLLTTHTLHVGTAVSETETLNEMLHSFWELESLGVKQLDKCLLTEFEEKIKLKDGHYQVSLPWKDVCPPLLDNYQLALKRLRGLRHRLQQRPALMKDHSFEHTSPPGGSLHVELPFDPKSSQVFLNLSRFHNGFDGLCAGFERLAIVRHNYAGQTTSGRKPLQTSEEGGSS